MKNDYDNMFSEGYDECFENRERNMEDEFASGTVTGPFAIGYEIYHGILANGGTVSSEILAEEFAELCSKFNVNPSEIKESIRNSSHNDDPNDFFNLVEKEFKAL